jgi:hypothetical protein
MYAVLTVLINETLNGQNMLIYSHLYVTILTTKYSRYANCESTAWTIRVTQLFNAICSRHPMSKSPAVKKQFSSVVLRPAQRLQIGFTGCTMLSRFRSLPTASWRRASMASARWHSFMRRPLTRGFTSALRRSGTPLQVPRWVWSWLAVRPVNDCTALCMYWSIISELVVPGNNESSSREVL